MLCYSEFEPHQRLRPFIECLWLLKSPAGKLFKKRELIIPGGRAEMMFNFGDPVTWLDSKDLSTFPMHADAFILGPRNRHFFVEQTGACDMIGVRFRHGGISAFTKIPVQEFLNQVVSSRSIFAKDTHHWMTRLSEISDDKLKVQFVEMFLAEKLQEDATTNQSLALISFVKRSEDASIQTITDKTGVHYKKLERIFSQYTGYSPKNFKKVIRFYQAVRSMKNQTDRLTGIGLDHGYHDQPHFIRDFKTFTGKSPSQFHLDSPAIASLILQSKYV
jgi:AraC-like DNA-binding protein